MTGLEEYVLNELRDEPQTVTIFTTNGFQMKGKITGVGQHMIVIDIGGEQAFLYKTAISTIKPEKAVDFGPFD